MGILQSSKNFLCVLRENLNELGDQKLQRKGREEKLPGNGRSCDRAVSIA
jgi:hypothetical protein